MAKLYISIAFESFPARYNLLPASFTALTLSLTHPSFSSSSPVSDSGSGMGTDLHCLIGLTRGAMVLGLTFKQGRGLRCDSLTVLNLLA